MRQVQPEHIQIAATLRRMREQAGVGRDQAAVLLGCTISKIGDLETGRSRPKPVELERLLDHYGVMGDERGELLLFARNSRGRRAPGPYTAATVPNNHRRIVDLEAQAISSICYSGELIPGILQIPAYAKALLDWSWNGKPDEVEKLLALRMERGKLLTRVERPPLRYWCILGEGALRTTVGDDDVMREQVERLVRFNTTTDNVVIQVMPFDGGPHAFRGMLATLHRFPPPAPDILLTDSYGRETVQDKASVVERATRHLELLRGMALSREASTEHMREFVGVAPGQR
ncbi:helix-turn-helix domain-containing protein [Actinosynnema pretiosum subsp. pretiosum]|uniref:Helix-turn-helix domain-containing protein n=1 Tax=Actinosynnema pretiosum subsp. pretiosum TaxID=103721 RepID=A0AA45L9P6_9PSEU|nr:transcriptional regulator, XRE family [Actinosynnema pretiosum subsp. pretiosum]QUF06239.1 helix-turn-helix domain-containing protein [Actinosynnema pretiosum subsp. pretiosum]